MFFPCKKQIWFRLYGGFHFQKVVCDFTEGVTIEVTFTLPLTPENFLESTHSLAAKTLICFVTGNWFRINISTSIYQL